MSLSSQIKNGFDRLTAAINAVNTKVENGTTVVTPVGSTNNSIGLALVNFGSVMTDSAKVTIPCTLVNADSSVIVLSPNTKGTADNDTDEHLYGEYTLKAVNIVDGVSFDILMESTTKFGFKGSFKINWSVVSATPAP